MTGRFCACVEAWKEGELKWGLPGGGAEPGEFVWDTVARECREELGVEAKMEALLAIAYAVFQDGSHGIRFAVKTSLVGDAAFTLEEGTTAHWLTCEEAHAVTGRVSPGFHQFVDVAFGETLSSPVIFWLRDTEIVEPPFTP